MIPPEMEVVVVKVPVLHSNSVNDPGRRSGERSLVLLLFVVIYTLSSEEEGRAVHLASLSGGEEDDGQHK